MKEKLLLVLKGFVLGIANIIPGVSGGTLAITLGIYEELIGIVSHFFSNIKKNILFIIPIGIGAVLSILLGSKIVNYTLDHYKIATTLFFIGLIIGGIPLIYKKVKKEKKEAKHIITFLITFFFIIGLTFLKSGENTISLETINITMIITLFLVGGLAAATMIIPGISGSFVLMLLGFYEPITETIASLTDFSLLTHNIMILAPFGIGIGIGIILIAKIIEYLLKKHEELTYYAILGFIFSSIISLIMSFSGMTTNPIEIIIGAVLFIVGSIIGYKLGGE
ncbi:MAG: DUF368 domain-containing protein [Bacilli bacterium]|nr:DUF368 domain-containing protein [Bacilli bacterium]